MSALDRRYRLLGASDSRERRARLAGIEKVRRGVFAEPDVVYQIGVAPQRIDLRTTISGVKRLSDCSVFVIDPVRFGDPTRIDSRVAAAPHADQGALSTALAYLDLDDGPINLPRDRLKLAERYLDQAERVVVRWLYTRTNGSERKNYGRNALWAARAAQY